MADRWKELGRAERKLEEPEERYEIGVGLDPVTGPRWGEEAASHLPRSLHLVVPGAHGVDGRCTNDISRRFLESGSLEALDTSCITNLRLPPFALR